MFLPHNKDGSYRNHLSNRWWWHLLWLLDTKFQQSSGWPSRCLGILAWRIIRGDFVAPSNSRCKQSVSVSCDRQWHTGPHSENTQFNTMGRKDLSLPDKMTSLLPSEIPAGMSSLSVYLSMYASVYQYLCNYAFLNFSRYNTTVVPVVQWITNSSNNVIFY